MTTLKASHPDAILVIAFDQTKALVKEMISQGIDTNKLYLTDGNTQDYSGDFDPGVLKGDSATIPGAEASNEFQKRIKSIDSSVKNFTYAAETYDAVVLSALPRRAVRLTARQSRTICPRSPVRMVVRSARATRSAWL